MTPHPLAAPPAPAGATVLPPTTPEPPAYPLYRQVWECAAVATGVGLIVFVLPFGSRGYLALCAVVTAATLAYAAYGLWRVPGTARRWGVVGNPRRAEGIARGLGWAILMVAVGVIPVVVGRAVIERPPLTSPVVYFLWCAVQDFVFFPLFLRNLLDHIPRPAAIVLTALMFALSHYPFVEMMAVTVVAAVVWGYIFSTSRVLWFVFLPHWLLGHMLLG
jgi:membrane protease YdiL (CAAX protease family)